MGPQRFRFAALVILSSAVTMASPQLFATGADLPDAPSEVAAQRNFTAQQQLLSTQSPYRKPLVTVPPEPRDAYVPLTEHEKFQNYAHVAKSPYTFGKTAIDAAVSQLKHGGEHYGDGFAGYGKRYGVSLAARETSMFVGAYLFPAATHQDPRFFYSTSTSIKGRAAHAASRVLLTRSDSGRTVFNSSYMFSNMVNSALGNLWDLQGKHSLSNTFSGIGYNYVSDAAGNIWREFWPDIHRKLHRHEPKTVQTMERKMKEWNPKGKRFEYPQKSD